MAQTNTAPSVTAGRIPRTPSERSGSGQSETGGQPESAPERGRDRSLSALGVASGSGESSHLGEVRGEGLLIAVEFVENRDQRQFFDPAKKVDPTLAANLLKEGIIARAMPQGDILGFAPPLCISQGEADQIVQGMRNVVKATFDA